MKIYKGLSRLFMAFSQGKESTKLGDFKKYVGLGAVKVLAVNPTREQWNELFESSSNVEPINYITEQEIGGKKVKSIRVSFVVKTTDDKENNGVDMMTTLNFFVQERFETNRDNTKVKVMDSFGRTAWVTKEELSSHAIPIYSNGPANISKDYRAVYRGEDRLTAFIRAYLGIDDIDFFNRTSGKWEQRADVDKCRGRLDDVKKYFSGNVSEIREVMTYQPDNVVKVIFGVRTSEDNREYQTFFADMFLKYNQRSTSYLNTQIQQAQQQGGYPNTVFSVENLKEYDVPPTDFTKVNSAKNPNSFFKQDTGADLPFDLEPVEDLPEEAMPPTDEAENIWGI